MFSRLTAKSAWLAVVLLFVIPCGGANAAKSEPNRPNIVILLADDLGWKDVSFHGAPFETPNIDKLVADGVELTRFYSCPVCSPTRAGLMTGRWPIRFGMMRAVLPPWRDYGLPTAQQTLAEALGDLGYESRAIIGKWHLGHRRVKWLPLNQGFTYFYGHYNGALDYFTHERAGQTDWHRNEKTIHVDGYSTTLLADEAVRFIEKSATEGAPFLLYVPFNAVHGPYQPPRGSLKEFSGIEPKRRRQLAAMAGALDEAIGRIRAAIDKAGASENTIVWFFSDNGGRLPASSNEPLRGQKATVYEGGVRVPAAVMWPGVLPAGTHCDQVMGYIDIMPTMLAIAGGDPETAPQSPVAPGLSAGVFDGRNVLPAIRDGKTMSPRPWYHYIHQNGPRSERFAVLDHGWKLVATGGSVLDAAWETNLKVELFQLADDPLEKHDLAAEHPEQVARLRKLAVAFLKLRPKHHVPRYGVGRKGFEAPKDWVIRESGDSGKPAQGRNPGDQ